MSRVAWHELMRFGLSELRLTPDVFWSLTPAEFMIIAGRQGGFDAAISRSGLNDLMDRFPDKSME